MIVSTDFIKSDRRRNEFLRTCPELVVVDEAHTCAYASEGRGGRHQRHQLVSGLAADENRHLVLVTATPHSGNEAAFRSLLTLLHPEFAHLPDDLAGRENEHHRRRLAAHFVQRRQGDIRHYLDAETPFPQREDREETYKLSTDYKRFCRFIPTAEYVAAALREQLPKGVAVAAITGLLPPAEREERVLQLAQSPRHVLVCTDCLSEGINLQEHFDAVIHYDLSWNPTRHEQREGRVDRYGQPSPTVRALTYYGIDNQIDGIVLDVLIRKHRTIRSSLGISVPVPVDTEQVVEAIFEGLLLREGSGNAEQYLPGLEEFFKPQKEDLFDKWDAVAEREKRSRTMFAQETIKVDEVARELQAARSAIGSGGMSLPSLRKLSALMVVSGQSPPSTDHRPPTTDHLYADTCARHLHHDPYRRLDPPR